MVDAKVITLYDKTDNKAIAPRTLASAIMFSDGESLQDKLDNGKITIAEG